MALDLLAIDTETTGVGWYDNAFMISVATDEWSWVYDKRGMPEDAWYFALQKVMRLIIKADKIIMHNAKFDMHMLNRLGFNLDLFEDKFEDTQAIAHLIDEQQSTSLKYLARTVLGKETDEDEVLKVWRRKNKLKKEDGYEPIPYEILAPYAQKDAEFTLELYKTLMPRLADTLYPLYEMEKTLTMSLLKVEQNGMRIDRDYVVTQRKEYGDRIYKLKHRIGEIAGKEFNPQSPQQVLSCLGARGVSIDKTDKATLASVEDELAQLIVELREANKIKSTYFDALYDESWDSILHPNFRQHGTRTGRMSSGSAEA